MAEREESVVCEGRRLRIAKAFADPAVSQVFGSSHMVCLFCT